MSVSTENQAGRATPFDRSQPLTVRAEAVIGEPMPWAWAIYRGPDRVLIVRSRPDFGDPAAALDAGLEAAGRVGNRLRTEVVAEAERPCQEPA
jgi:hypothetical protein